MKGQDRVCVCSPCAPEQSECTHREVGWGAENRWKGRDRRGALSAIPSREFRFYSPVIRNAKGSRVFRESLLRVVRQAGVKGDIQTQAHPCDVRINNPA